MIVQSPNFARKPSPLKIDTPAWNEDVLIPKPVILTSPLKSKTASNVWSSRDSVSSARKSLFGTKPSSSKPLYQTNAVPLSPTNSFNKPVLVQQTRPVSSASSSPVTPVNNISSPRSSTLEFEAGLEIQHILQGTGIEKAPVQQEATPLAAPNQSGSVEQRSSRISPSAQASSSFAPTVTTSAITATSNASSGFVSAAAALLANDEMFELDSNYQSDDDDAYVNSSADRVIVITAQHKDGASIVRSSAANFGHGSLWSLDDDDDMNMPRYQHRNYNNNISNNSMDHNLHHHEHLLAIANIHEMTPPVRADNPIYMDSRFYNDMHCAMSPSEQHDGAELGIFNFSPPRLCSSH